MGQKIGWIGLRYTIYRLHRYHSFIPSPYPPSEQSFFTSPNSIQSIAAPSLIYISISLHTYCVYILSDFLCLYLPISVTVTSFFSPRVQCSAFHFLYLSLSSFLTVLTKLLIRIHLICLVLAWFVKHGFVNNELLADSCAYQISLLL